MSFYLLMKCIINWSWWSRKGAIDASNILKPYLARRDLTLVGATTIEEYYQYFEKDQAMNRRFAIIKMKEYTKEETLDILKGLKKQYQDYHHIEIEDDTLSYLIKQCDVYLPQRVFPDKAIDIFDLACVKANFLHEQIVTKQYIDQVIEEVSGLTLEQDIPFTKLEEQLNQDSWSTRCHSSSFFIASNTFSISKYSST